MPLRGGSYFSENEREHPFIDKALGLAKLAGIVAAGASVAKPMLSSYGGPFLRWVSQGLQHQKVFDTTKHTGTTPGDFLKFSTGRDTKALYDMSESFRVMISDLFLHPKRINKAEQGIKRLLTEESKNLLDENEKLGSWFRRRLSAFGPADQAQELNRTILNRQGINRLQSDLASKGIYFQNQLANNTAEILLQIKRVASDIKTLGYRVSDSDIADAISKPGNAETILKALGQIKERENKLTSVLGRAIGVQKEHHVTWADIQTSENLRGQMENQLKASGYKTAETGSKTPFLDAVEKQMEDSLSELFPHSDNPGNLDQARDLFRKSLTGFARDKHGGLIPLGVLNQIRKGVGASIMSELQVPLLPPFFNVPASLFKFGSTLKDPVRIVGKMSGLSELRRSGKLPEDLSEDAMGMLVGKHLLVADLNQEGVTVKLLDNLAVNAYDTQKSAHLARFHQIRGLDPESVSDRVTDQMNQNGAIGGALGFFGEKDRHSYSLIDKFVSATGRWPKWFPTSYEVRSAPGIGFGPSYNNERLRPFLHKRFADKVGIDPVAELKHIIDNEGYFDDPLWAGDLSAALHDDIREAAKSRISSADTLIKLAEDIDELPYPTELKPILKELFLSSGDPEKLRDLIFQTREELGGKSLSQLHTELYNETPVGFAGTIYSIAKHRNLLTDTNFSAEGRGAGFVGSILGHTGISPTMQKFQEGMLSFDLQARGIQRLLESSGGLDELSRAANLAAQENVDALVKTPFSRAMAGININEPQRQIAILNSLFHSSPKAGSLENYRQMGYIGTVLREHEEILSVSQSRTTRAKLTDMYSQALDELPGQALGGDVIETTMYKNQLIFDLTKKADVVGELEERFGILGKSYHQDPGRINPADIGRILVLPTEATELVDFVEDPVGSFFRSAHRGFGISDFLKGVVDPEAPVGHWGMMGQILHQMPQRLGEELGLGLSEQDSYTILRSTMAFYGKRIFPIVVGWEAYKNINSNLHEAGLPGIDDMGAHFVANVNLWSSYFRDALHLTPLFKDLVGSMPGLEQYFHPRSYEEYKDYLFYGDEEVRRGRGWLIGSRSPLPGSDVKYYRPSFYRRWTSHWTEEAGLSDPSHSWLPSPLHPLAPLLHVFDPNHFVWSHRFDRPYAGGGWPGRQQDSQETYIETNVAGGGAAIGAFGGAYPIGLSGGTHPYGAVGGTFDASTLLGIGPGSEQGPMGLGGGTGAIVGADGTVYGKSGDPVHLSMHQGAPTDLQENTPYNALVGGFNKLRMQAGLYGAIAQLAPIYPHRSGAFEIQDPSYPTSFSRAMWWGERGEMGMLGPLGEFFRRFITFTPESTDAYNPLPNNMPSWINEKFRHGDPYLRTAGIGELQLPGPAFLATHPWVKPLKVRGSAIGLSETEIMQKWLNPMDPIDDADQEEVLEFGSRVHKQVQRNLYRSGMLIGAEVSIADNENDLSGTIDAIVRGIGGPRLLEIKTQGGKHWGEVPERYKDQLTFYMANTNIHEGSLVFVNRDNPNQIRVVDVPFDQQRWQGILQRVGRARERMTDLINKGVVSPFESYDLLSRLEVLARVAPESREYQETLEFAETGGGFGGFEKQRFNQLKKEAQKLKERYNLYPYRYNVKKQTGRVVVQDITENGDIVTDLGTIRLAGVEWDNQAFAYEDPAEVLSKFGVQIGDSIQATMLEGQFNPELTSDITLPAIVGGVNRSIANSPYAHPMEDTRNPLDSQVVYGNRLLGHLWEKLVHGDNFVSNKLLRVRSPLEQFERGEVFGTDRFGWDHLYSNYVAPTITSYIAKNPVTSAIQSAITASLFVRNRAAKLKVATYAGALGATLSTLRVLYENISGNVWVPGRYKKQSAFDEYWDVLEYVKEVSIAERAKRMARKTEGVDIDKLNEEENRKFKPVGPYAMLAIQAERRAKRTMAGFDEMHGNLQDAIASLPRRQQQIAQEIILSGGADEKRRFFELLPRTQRRVLGRFLGADPRDIPEHEDLSDYFKHHTLPDAEWEGWDPMSNMDDLRTRAEEHEKTRVEMPSNSQVSKAWARTKEVSIPRMDHPTLVSIRRNIEDLLNRPGFNDLNVSYDVRPSSELSVNVNLDLFHDQTSDLHNEMKKDLMRS